MVDPVDHRHHQPREKPGHRAGEAHVERPTSGPVLRTATWTVQTDHVCTGDPARCNVHTVNKFSWDRVSRASGLGGQGGHGALSDSGAVDVASES